MKRILFLSLFLMSSVFASSKSSAQEPLVYGPHVSSEVSDDEEGAVDQKEGSLFQLTVLNHRKEADLLEKMMTVEEKEAAALKAFFFHITQSDCDKYIESFFSVFGNKYLGSQLLTQKEQDLMALAFEWYSTIK